MTPTGLALLDRHRAEQAKISSNTLLLMLRLWALLVERGRVEDNTDRWLSAALTVLAAQRAASATTAATYLGAYRQAELGPDAPPFTLTPATQLDVEAVRTSLMVTGPVAYKREVARQQLVQSNELPSTWQEARLPSALTDKLAASSARAAQRHVQNGARDTTDELIRSDKAVVGYARTTSDHPCFFCAMLASRGPVYDKDSFEDSDPRFHGPGHQKVHDGCGCALAPLYSRSNPAFLERTREFEALWRANNSALAFRRAYEGR